MGLRINQNIEATNSYRNLSVTQNQLSKSMEKLSSGFRINRAADDAAGLAISEGLRSQVGGLKVAVRNAQDGVSVAQTAEGALTEVHSMLQRMNDLSVQYNNGTQNTESQAALQAEFDALNTEITRIKDNTKFNGVDLFAGAALTFQVGYDNTDTIAISATALADFTAGAAVAAVDITDSNTLQAAITEVSTACRARCGAEPVRAHDQQRQRRDREPVGLRVAHPRHRHGPGDDEPHPLADPQPGRHGHARPGQLGPQRRAPAAPRLIRTTS